MSRMQNQGVHHSAVIMAAVPPDPPLFPEAQHIRKARCDSSHAGGGREEMCVAAAQGREMLSWVRQKVRKEAARPGTFRLVGNNGI